MTSASGCKSPSTEVIASPSSSLSLASRHSFLTLGGGFQIAGVTEERPALTFSGAGVSSTFCGIKVRIVVFSAFLPKQCKVNLLAILVDYTGTLSK